MSVIFYVKNRKKLLGLHKKDILTVGNSLKIYENIQQFTYTPEEIEEHPDILNISLEKVHLVLGEKVRSFRGFELHYEKEEESYSIRIMTPSTRQDWLIGLEYIRLLALYLDSGIEVETGKKYNPADIKNYSFLKNIELGIEAFKEVIRDFKNVEKDDVSNSSLYSEEIVHQIGINQRPVCLSKEMVEKILYSENRIEEYEKTVYNISNIDAEDAIQSFYKNEKENKIFGSYIFIPDSKKVYPYKPYVEVQNDKFIKQEEVDYWLLHVMTLNKNNEYTLLGTLDYDLFIKYLPKNKYRFIDGVYILVEPFTEYEIKYFYGEYINKI